MKLSSFRAFGYSVTPLAAPAHAAHQHGDCWQGEGVSEARRCCTLDGPIPLLEPVMLLCHVINICFSLQWHEPAALLLGLLHLTTWYRALHSIAVGLSLLQ